MLLRNSSRIVSCRGALAPVALAICAACVPGPHFTDTSASASDGTTDATSATSTPTSTTTLTTTPSTTPGTSATETESTTDTSSTTSSVECGNGEVEEGEECDGEKSGDGYGGCKDDCMLEPYCGDGEVQDVFEDCDPGDGDPIEGCESCQANCGDGIVVAGVEACDDGDMDDDDECTNACTVATCGDGVVQTGVEECDDGNRDDSDACSNDCFSARRIFVTASDEYQGIGLKGIGGADDICNEVGGAIQPPVGVLRAWISDGNVGPSTRFFGVGKLPMGFPGRFVLADGVTTVAEGWGGLTSGALLAPINLDQNSIVVGENDPDSVWTHTLSDGSSSVGVPCKGWLEEEVDGILPMIGSLYKHDSKKWTDFIQASCKSTARLYCVEVGPRPLQ